MATTIASGALVSTTPVFTQAERLALADLAGYCGLTREAYQMDLRGYTSWCLPLWPGSIATRWKRNYSTILRPRMSAVRAWSTSPTRLGC